VAGHPVHRGRIRISEHALEESSRRGIPPEVVQLVASAPEQCLPAQRGREIRQSRLPFAREGRTYLVRVVVEPGAWDQVVTVYRTSRIDKYWARP
jgi:hypothetical protein